MKRGVFLMGASVAGLLVTMALHERVQAQAETDAARCEKHPMLCELIKQRLGEVKASERVNPPGAQSFRYGGDERQTVDVWRPGQPKVKPLVVFVHGGGWTRGDKGNATGPAKVTWFTERGYAFASINYRLVPSVTVEDQARDVATAIHWLRGHAAEYGADPGKIILMGHSAGAHLAALVATDERYLGPDLKAVRNVVLLDGVGYDVPKQIEQAGPFVGRIYSQPFGSLDRSGQTRVSPTAHAAAPNAGAFLIVYDAQREDAQLQSEALGSALEAAGTTVDLMAVENSNHLRINFDVGKPDSPETDRIASFLEPVLNK